MFVVRTPLWVSRVCCFLIVLHEIQYLLLNVVHAWLCPKTLLFSCTSGFMVVDDVDLVYIFCLHMYLVAQTPFCHCSTASVFKYSPC
jgi:hypothetical protein